MVLFNYSTKELTAKVVYYGPGLCGKTTNLQWVHEKLPIKNKGKMLSLATETDRTLFFDFLPIEIGSIRGMKTRIQLYTVPGQVFYNATRRMVLKGADAVVFVCDSQEAMLDANLESFENMRQNLEANEIDPDEIPIVLQYNKRDLPNALPIEILNERMNPHNYPYSEAIAVTGVGVEDTLKSVTKLVFKSLSVKYGEGAAPPPAPGAPRSSAPPVSASRPPVAAPPSTSRPPVAAPAVVSAPPAPVHQPTPAPAFADGEEEDLLGDLSAPGAAPPLAPSPTPGPAMAPTPVEFEKTPASAFSAAVTGPGPAVKDPRGTLISTQAEALELRRRIANPGIPDPEPEVEMDLEELDELSGPAAGEFVPEPAPTVAAPDPPAGATEVEVPIDIEVAPGTTRISLNLRLILNLKPR